MATATARKRSTSKTKAKVPAAPASNHTTARHMRIPDDIWNAGQQSAVDNGYTGISELVRGLLRDYNSGKRMK